LDTASGAITGTPLSIPIGGTATLNFTVTDVNSTAVSKSLNLAITTSYRDVNEDGSVNISDVQLTVNLILQVNSPPPTNPFQGDVNKDLAVNVVDVQSIVTCILAPVTCQ
jgi:hypothetical protein